MSELPVQQRGQDEMRKRTNSARSQFKKPEDSTPEPFRGLLSIFLSRLLAVHPRGVVVVTPSPAQPTLLALSARSHALLTCPLASMQNQLRLAFEGAAHPSHSPTHIRHNPHRASSPPSVLPAPWHTDRHAPSCLLPLPSLPT